MLQCSVQTDGLLFYMVDRFTGERVSCLGAVSDSQTKEIIEESDVKTVPSN